ncbi:MAG: phosphatidylserine decarboxylase [Alphaproteobacteria bacterium]|nr:phosphatidylserine decarboxylase [Alphaproteobacteria bacterium]
MWRRALPPIHPDGWRFIAIFAAVTLILFWIAQPLGWLGAIATIWCVTFFRSPWRVTPQREGLVVAPADGVVVAVDEAVPPAELGMGEAPMRRIGIFLSIFDVHVNRVPVAGRVVKTAYRKGKFVNAALDKASEDNERMAIRLALADGTEIAVVQIAGLIARRILCELNEDQTVIAGQRLGLIRFGSRTDLYLPSSWSHFAIVGQRMVGGETVLADRRANEGPRSGRVH